MFLVCVDCSKNNLLTEQLNVRSFYDLPILNLGLPELQLKNFADVSVNKCFVINSEKEVDFSLFETVCISESDFYKELFSFDDNEKIVLFRNDVYFECEIPVGKSDYSENGIGVLNNEKGECFSAVCSVNTLKKLNNKNIVFLDLLCNCKKYADYCVNLQGYTKFLSNIKDYKALLFDILNGKTDFKPPYIAEGIFTAENVPRGDFSIVPPVYIGKSVQIESGSSVGPNTVIYDSSVISTDTVIKNSVLFENVYISSGCYVDGCVCCNNASVKRNSAVFAGSVIGENSLIGEDMTVENDSYIKKNVRYDNYVKSPFTNKIDSLFKNKFQGMTPDKAALLGSAVAAVLGRPKVLIASDGAPNSLAIKLAFLSGLIASGAECFDMGVTFKAHIFFSSLFCESDYSVFFSGRGGGTDIEIFDSKNTPLSKAQCCNLLNFCNKGDFVFVGADECKNVRQIHGLRRMYVREITALFCENQDFVPEFSCENEIITKTVEDIFKKISKDLKVNEGFCVNMNEYGTSVNIKYNNNFYSCRDLKRLASFYMKKDLNEFDNDIYKSLWNSDCIFVLFAILNIIKKTGKNIHDLMAELPDFHISTKSIESPLKPGETARKLDGLKKIYYKDGSYKIGFKEGLVNIVNKPFLKRFEILCGTENMSFSKELCDFFSTYLEES
ncbi:MAG: hypothetical protein ACI4VW_00195 [Acutalibacteraceae bacterium]